MMNKRPNILFLMSDEHRADVAGYENNEVVRTPVLDRLAESGVVFRNAYTPSPICVPARQCMMSGQLPKTCGCEGWVDLEPGYRTFARELSRYAYNTVCSGKLHHQGTDQMQGWTGRIAPDAAVQPKFIEDRVVDEFSRYEREPGTGKWSNKKEIQRAGIAYGLYQHFDTAAVEAAEHFIEYFFSDPYYDRPPGLQFHPGPLLLKVSLLQPHYPFFTDEAKFKYYLNRVPLHTDMPCDHPVLSQSHQNQPLDVSPRDIKRATAAYYGMVETVDEHYGRILDKLDMVGQDIDDWIVIYTSDHGEMLGQHGLWEKGRFYEASVRVPLIIRWPAGFDGGRICEKNVNLCDLFATICELSGLPVPEGLDSRSLVPLLTGDQSHWDNESVSYFKFFDDDHFMIKQDDLKYQYYGENVPEVLFDLSKDPGEKTNAIKDPAYAAAIKRFRKRLTELGGGPTPS